MPDGTAVLVPIVVTDDDPASDVNQAVYGWLAGYPLRTRRNYHCMVNQWLEWCHDFLHVHPFAVKRSDVDKYPRWLEEYTSNLPSTIAHKLSASLDSHPTYVLNAFLSGG